MGRTAKSKELKSAESGFSEKRMAEADQATQELARMNVEAADNAHALAEQFGYEGSLTVGAVEDEIRHYQRRTAEACFELGKRLLILKELTPHGEFQQRIDLLGIEVRAAQRLMSIASKFCKSVNLSLLKASGTQTKLLELLILDDSEIEAIEAGETVRNLDLDKIETMSVRELKVALREAQTNLDTKERQIGDKNAKLDELDAKLTQAKRRAARETPDKVAEALRGEATVEAYAAEAAVTASLRPVVRALVEHGQANNQSHEDFIVGLLCQIEAAISGIRGEFQLKDKPDGEDMPEWMRPGFDPLLAAHGKPQKAN